MMSLTPRQAELLIFIKEFQVENGYVPSYSEMATAMGVSSKSGIQRLIIGLEERGAIRRLRGRARAIEVLT